MLKRLQEFNPQDDERQRARLFTSKFITMEKLIQELNEAKSNVLWLLENSEGSVDMHGIEYWAGRVEKLRAEIKSNL